MGKFEMFCVRRGLGTLVATIIISGAAMAQGAAKQDSISTIPAEITTLLKPSCIPCHSNEGRDKPKAKVNFSVWEQYSPMEKSMLGASMLEEVKKGSMPPKRFLESHPEAVLTEAQIGQIAQWCESLKLKP